MNHAWHETVLAARRIPTKFHIDIGDPIADVHSLIEIVEPVPLPAILGFGVARQVRLRKQWSRPAALDV